MKRRIAKTPNEEVRWKCVMPGRRRGKGGLSVERRDVVIFHWRSLRNDGVKEACVHWMNECIPKRSAYDGVLWEVFSDSVFSPAIDGRYENDLTGREGNERMSQQYREGRCSSGLMTIPLSHFCVLGA